jgi:hypothetical protein
VTHSCFVEVLPVFIHVLPWQSEHHSFTVTRMSGNVTTYVEQNRAADLSCAEAAALLGVPPAALERWAQRLEYPHAMGGASAGTRFKRAEVEALRDALVRTHSVEGAVRAARDRTAD